MSAATGTIVVTGASSGIGRATALRLAARGHRVLAGVRRDADGQALVVQDAAIEPIVLDVTDPAHVAALGERVAGTPLTGVVNNAGIAVAGPLEAVPLDELRRQYEVNVFGQIAVTQAVLPAVRAGVGRIVNIGSIGGGGGAPFLRPLSYPEGGGGK